MSPWPGRCSRHPAGRDRVGGDLLDFRCADQNRQVAEADETRLAHLIAAKAERADLVLIDTAGFGNRAASVAMTSADAVLVPSLLGEVDITEAERTVQLTSALARAARRDIPARIIYRIKRTTLSCHAMAELAAAGLPRLSASLSDLVAYGELTYSGKLPNSGPAATEAAGLVAELRELGWLARNAVVT